MVYEVVLFKEAQTSYLEIDRLRSSPPLSPSLREARFLDGDSFSTVIAWKEKWNNNGPAGYLHMPCITDKPPGFELLRKTRGLVNRIRTKEHQRLVWLEDWGKSRLAQHAWEEDHRIAWNKAAFLHKEDSVTESNLLYAENCNLKISLTQ
ncbi:hypothetical protein Trydic_g15182 [Trypoxylus dichotomus]